MESKEARPKRTRKRDHRAAWLQSYYSSLWAEQSDNARLQLVRDEVQSAYDRGACQHHAVIHSVPRNLLGLGSVTRRRTRVVYHEAIVHEVPSLDATHAPGRPGLGHRH